MNDGVVTAQGLDQQIEKNSSSLGRSATYNVKSRLSRLPAYLTIHMVRQTLMCPTEIKVRFYWRRDIQKKAKIMRKVKFPLQLDVLDIVTDELRQSLQPVNAAVKQILKARDDRASVAKRSKGKVASVEEMSEDACREQERKEVAALVSASGLTATGSNPSGIYELCGKRPERLSSGF